MTRKHQIKLSVNLTVTEGTPEYDGVYWIKNGLMSERDAVSLAIATTYSMVGAAARGADKTKVEGRIAYSNEAMHGFQMSALSRIEGRCSDLELTENRKPEPQSKSFKDDENYVDISEEF